MLRIAGVFWKRQAQRVVQAEFTKGGWTEADWKQRCKTGAVKVLMAAS
jgi:hypothetical protein